MKTHQIVAFLLTSAGSIAAAALPDSEPIAGAIGIGDSYYPALGAGGYDAQHYELVLDVDMSTGEIDAKTTLTAIALHSLSSFNLDLYGLEVARVLVDGKKAEYRREGRELTIIPQAPIASGAEFTSKIYYYGAPEPAPDASHPMGGVGWNFMDSGVYVVSECVGAASWFPCNDHQRDKATYSITVTVADPFIVAANGIPGETVSADGHSTFSFSAKEPMAPYLVTVNIAKFDVFEETGPRNIPIITYHPIGATERELAPFRRQGEIIEFLETCFGPYPFESSGAIISYEFLGGALETQTRPVYSRGLPETVVVHELAHQWFGDSVSADEWKDMWLNEGFATYGSFLWLEHTQGAEAAAERARANYRRLRETKTGPPLDPGVRQVFSSRTYERGAWVLHTLRLEVGDDVFFEILKTWVDAHRNSTATSEQFMAHCEAKSGRDLEAFFAGVLAADVIPEDPRFE